MSIGDPTAPAVRYKSIKADYRIGDDGSVWSHARGSWQPLKPTAQYRGHLLVWLGGRDCQYVHRLVLEAFVGPCPKGMECRHLDGNPANNHVGNLAWGTPAENGMDRIRHGRIRMKLTKDQAREIRRRSANGALQADLAHEFGVSQASISHILSRKTWKWVGP